MDNKTTPKIKAVESLIVIVSILSILGYLIIAKKQAPQIPLLISISLLMLYGYLRGFSWDVIVDGVAEGIKLGAIPMLIFILIGVLIATWIYSGTIPTIMYFGFNILSVNYFLPTVFIVCSLMGIVAGSSFTTISTLGIAFLGIGLALKINIGLTAGVIVSGAYFGANVSPLSGTTNLAAGIGEINLYDHIKNLLWTDLPAWIISLVLYVLLGLRHSNASLKTIQIMMIQLKHGFWISSWTLLPIILLLLLAWRKVPAIPSLAFGSFFALIIGYIHKPVKVNILANYIMNGYVAKTGSHQMDTLLSKGGISSMLGSLALIIFALALGGLLIKFDIINSLLNSISNFISSFSRLNFTTIIACLGVNYLVGEQYLSIILPGESFKNSYDKINLPRKYLTRVLNDAGAAVNSIVPWSVSGIFISSTLKVNPLQYIHFAFFPIIVLLINLVMGFKFHKSN